MGSTFCLPQLVSGILVLPQTGLYQAMAICISVYTNKHFVAFNPTNL